MQSIKEKASNIAASARSGMEKTKATLEEKAERVTAHDPLQKEMATEKKEERIRQAELDKQEAMQNNAAAKKAGGGGFTAAGTRNTATTHHPMSGMPAAGGHEHEHGTTTTTATHSYSTTGEFGRSTGGHQMSAMPGHGTGRPAGQVEEGRAEAHPIGVNTGVGGAKSHNTRVEGNPHGYGTGGTYS